MSSEVLKVCCKAFIQPEVIPPIRTDQVTEPLVWKFMSNYCSNALFVGSCWSVIPKQQQSLSEILTSVCDNAILHNFLRHWNLNSFMNTLRHMCGVTSYCAQRSRKKLFSCSSSSISIGTLLKLCIVYHKVPQRYITSKIILKHISGINKINKTKMLCL